MAVKIKKQKVQRSVPKEKNWSLKIIKNVWKEFKLKIKQTFYVDSLKTDYKKYIKIIN